MTTVRTVVEEVSTYLVDQEPEFEFTHWSEVEILTYLQDALRILAMNAKHLFVSDKVITLRPGENQTLAAGCDELRSVQGNVDRHGNLTTSTRRTSLRAAQTINRPMCGASEEGYRVGTYQMDPGNPKTFNVQPPVPTRGTHRVLVSCYGVPLIRSVEEELPVPDTVIPIVKEFMMYYAYGQDTESVPAREYQRTHWSNGAALLAAYKTNPTAILTVPQTPAEVPV